MIKDMAQASHKSNWKSFCSTARSEKTGTKEIKLYTLSSIVCNWHPTIFFKIILKKRKSGDLAEGIQHKQIMSDLLQAMEDTTSFLKEAEALTSSQIWPQIHAYRGASWTWIQVADGKINVTENPVCYLKVHKIKSSPKRPFQMLSLPLYWILPLRSLS